MEHQNVFLLPNHMASLSIRLVFRDFYSIGFTMTQVEETMSLSSSLSNSFNTGMQTGVYENNDIKQVGSQMWHNEQDTAVHCIQGSWEQRPLSVSRLQVSCKRWCPRSWEVTLSCIAVVLREHSWLGQFYLGLQIHKKRPDIPNLTGPL